MLINLQHDGHHDSALDVALALAIMPAVISILTGNIKHVCLYHIIHACIIRTYIMLSGPENYTTD